ncbi:unnamed protein product, partial [Choristocarpus tenellus]
MAEIVAKYGSKERELGARLMKKYGVPLPTSVSTIKLHEVLAEFNMVDEDHTPHTSGGVQQAAGSSGEMLGDGKVGINVAPRAREEPIQDAAGEAEDDDEDLEDGEINVKQKLDFLSSSFDPLEALTAAGASPPFPDEPSLDNITKCRSMVEAVEVTLETRRAIVDGRGGEAKGRAIPGELGQGLGPGNVVGCGASA